MTIRGIETAKEKESREGTKRSGQGPLSARRPSVLHRDPRLRLDNGHPRVQPRSLPLFPDLHRVFSSLFRSSALLPFPPELRRVSFSLSDRPSRKNSKFSSLIFTFHRFDGISRGLTTVRSLRSLKLDRIIVSRNRKRRIATHRQPSKERNLW